MSPGLARAVQIANSKTSAICRWPGQANLLFAIFYLLFWTSLRRVQGSSLPGSKTKKPGPKLSTLGNDLQRYGAKSGARNQLKCWAAQLFHCVQHLLAARGDKRLKLARFFRLQLTGHLSRLGLELWRFCL